MKLSLLGILSLTGGSYAFVRQQQPLASRSLTLALAPVPADDSTSPWKPPAHWKFAGFRYSAAQTPLQSSVDGALMPDGGLAPCVIKVVGVGGGGSNAVDRMLDTSVGGVDFGRSTPTPKPWDVPKPRGPRS